MSANPGPDVENKARCGGDGEAKWLNPAIDLLSQRVIAQALSSAHLQVPKEAIRPGLTASSDARRVFRLCVGSGMGRVSHAPNLRGFALPLSCSPFSISPGVVLSFSYLHLAYIYHGLDRSRSSLFVVCSWALFLLPFSLPPPPPAPLLRVYATLRPLVPPALLSIAIESTCEYRRVSKSLLHASSSSSPGDFDPAHRVHE